MTKRVWVLMLVAVLGLGLAACSTEEGGKKADQDLDVPSTDGDFEADATESAELETVGDKEVPDAEPEGEVEDLPDQEEILDREEYDEDVVPELDEDADLITEEEPDREPTDVDDAVQDQPTDTEIDTEIDVEHQEPEVDTVVEVEPDEEGPLCECSSDSDCTAGFYCDGCFCQPRAGDEDEAEEEEPAVPYCIDVLCQTHDECPQGFYCDSGRCCKECRDDSVCIETYGTEYYCDNERGRCVRPPADLDPDLEPELEPEPICCVEHTDCGPAQWCDKPPEAECGTCRYGCWRDEQCQGGQFSGYCDLETHQCVFEQPELDEEEPPLEVGSISGTIYLSAELFDDVISITVQAYNEDPGLGKKADPIAETEADNPDSNAHTYSYAFDELPLGNYWLVVLAQFNIHPLVREESSGNPYQVTPGSSITDADFYLGVPDPAYGWIRGKVYVDSADSAYPVKVRVYTFDPEGSPQEGYTAEVYAGEYDAETGARPYWIGDLAEGTYYVLAFFESGRSRTREFAGNPVVVDYSSEATKHVENIDVYLTQIDPTLGSISGYVYMTATYSGMRCDVKLYASPDFDEASLVRSASVGSYSSAQQRRHFEANNLESGIYYIRAEVSIGSDKVYAPADPVSVEIDLSDPNKLHYSDVNCYVDVVQPNRGSVQGRITFHYCYYDYVPYIEVYDVPGFSLPPVQSFPLMSYDPWQGYGDYFVGNLEDGEWYIVASMRREDERFPASYASNPIVVSIPDSKDFTNIDIEIPPPLVWGSLRGQVEVGVANEMLMTYVEIYRYPRESNPEPVMQVMAYDWSPGDGILSYMMNRIPAGAQYEVVAHTDIGNDGDPSNDYWGEYEGNPLAFAEGIEDYLHYDNVNLVVRPPLEGTISGKVYVPDALAGKPIYVQLFTERPYPAWMPPSTQPVQSVTTTAQAGTQYAEYEFTGLSEGEYYVFAWVDENEDGQVKNEFFRWYGAYNYAESITINYDNPSVEVDFYLGTVPPGENYITGKVYVGDGAQEVQLWVEWVDPSAGQYPHDFYGPMRTSVGLYDADAGTFEYILYGIPNIPVDVWVSTGLYPSVYPAHPYGGNPLQFGTKTQAYSGVWLYYGVPSLNGGSISGSVELTAEGMDKLVYLRISPEPISFEEDPAAAFFSYGGANRTLWLWKRDTDTNTAPFEYAGAPLPSGDYYVYFILFKCNTVDENFVLVEYSGNPVHIDTSSASTKDVTGVNASFSGTDLTCPQR